MERAGGVKTADPPRTHAAGRVTSYAICIHTNTPEIVYVGAEVVALRLFLTPREEVGRIIIGDSVGETLQAVVRGACRHDAWMTFPLHGVIVSDLENKKAAIKSFSLDNPATVTCIRPWSGAVSR